MEVLARIAARNDIGLASFKLEMTTLLGSKETFDTRSQGRMHLSSQAQ